MQAGKLNRRCVIQKPSTEADELGQPVPGWADVARVWADVRMKAGLEAIKAGAPVSTAQASVRIRYRDGITAGMRLSHNRTFFNITAVLPDVARREFLDLICEVHS